VHVIAARTVKRYGRLHPDAAEELLRWNVVASKARWRMFVDVRQVFPDVDQFRNLLIFNVRHNVYRLIVKVDYASNLLMVKEFLTHKQYEKGEWKKWAR
jgi:mRNA interferase HigB